MVAWEFSKLYARVRFPLPAFLVRGINLIVEFMIAIHGASERYRHTAHGPRSVLQNKPTQVGESESWLQALAP